jgi:hypothetical protein
MNPEYSVPPSQASESLHRVFHHTEDAYLGVTQPKAEYALSTKVNPISEPAFAGYLVTAAILLVTFLRQRNQRRKYS